MTSTAIQAALDVALARVVRERPCAASPQSCKTILFEIARGHKNTLLMSLEGSTNF